MVSIKEVSTKKELAQFIKLPFALYKGHKRWVPPLISDERRLLGADTNPSFSSGGCEAAYFLAHRGGKAVGRIAAIVNHRANEKWKNKVARFGWVDFVDDYEASGALLKAAEQWSKGKGMTGIQGPMGFTDFDLQGMLVEGFEHLPPIISPYNHPYYPQHLEKHGYGKEVDWLQYRLNASQPIPEKIRRVNQHITQKYNLRTVIFKKRSDVMLYANKFFDAVNMAWGGMHGFVQFTPEQIDYYAKAFFSFIRPELFCLVLDDKDDVVGFGLCLPTLSRAFQKARGKLFPFGFIHILKSLYRYSEIDLYVNGVLPEWRNRGIHSLYYAAMNEIFIRRRIKVAISSSQLETNINALGIWDNYEKELLFRTRCYIKENL
ncbi:MAG: N-acetyltransferase [Prevotellaceae bacterium]|jgi:GNAT superfamily N-acetyltransferase|nr:N-acetyltransferase [Prevotellaceae bacterium]